MAKNPREPKAVNKLIADAQARIGKDKPRRPPVDGTLHTASSLWDRIRRRGTGQ